MSDSMSIKSAHVHQRNAVKNLNEKHQNELEKIKLAHKARKQILQGQQREQLADIKIEREKDMLNEAHKSEKALEKMNKSIKVVKERTEREADKIQKSYDAQLAAIKSQYQQELSAQRSNKQLQLEDMNEQANAEMKRLRRELEAEESKIRNNAIGDKRTLKARSQSELSMNKEIYHQKKNAAEDKYLQALGRQKSENSKVLAREEKKFQKALENRTHNYQRELGRIQKDGEFKKTSAQKAFEKSFAKVLAKNEEQIAGLKSQKESIIQKLKNEIIEAHKIDANKASDPFYSPSSLDPEIKKADGHYLVSLELGEEDAKSLMLNAHKRELTLALNRRYENTLNEDGATEKVKKVETMTRKFNVDEIVDPSKIEKNYNDGVVTFKVPLA